MHHEYSANSILAANTDDSPAALSIAEQRIVGRKTGGNIAALTNAEILAILSGGAGADFSLNNKKITSLANGVNPGDGVNKSQLDAVISSNDAMVFKGTVGSDGTHTIAAFNSLATYNIGWTYKAVEAGTIKGVVCEIGDTIIATTTRAGSGNVDADWMVVQANVDGAVVGPASVTDNRVAVFDGATGKVIKDGGVLVSDLATSTHVHGGISNDGKIGSTAGVPIITGTAGVLQAGSFGTGSGTFCQGNDSRLTDSRTPTSHAIAGSLHSASTLSDLNGKISDANLIDTNDTRLSDARTPTSHVHGNVTNDGKIGASANKVIVTGTDGVLEAKAAGTTEQFLRGDGAWAAVVQSDTATATDDILDGSNVGTAVKYAPYSTAEAASLKFYTHATDPTGTSRLNIGGYFHATRLYEGALRVLNENSTIDGGVFA
jgi:hypothetical protein